jgi:hypothetical protein
MSDMNTVELQERTARELAMLARAREVDPSVLADEAVRAYLRAERHRALEEEDKAYKRLHPDLVHSIFGEYAAVHGGELVDHDVDLLALYLRVEKRFEDLPVLIRKVKSEPEEVIVVRSPRIEYE